MRAWSLPSPAMNSPTTTMESALAMSPWSPSRSASASVSRPTAIARRTVARAVDREREIEPDRHARSRVAAVGERLLEMAHRIREAVLLDADLAEQVQRRGALLPRRRLGEDAVEQRACVRAVAGVKEVLRRLYPSCAGSPPRRRAA